MGITVFSAPNYCDMYKNKAAILKYNGQNLEIKQFSWVDHPYWLPGFGNAISFSMPYAMEKVFKILKAILGLCTDDELNDRTDEGNESDVGDSTDDSSGDSSDDSDNHIDMVRPRGTLDQKIKQIARIADYYRELRIENDKVLQLKALTPNGELPDTMKDGDLPDFSDGFDTSKEIDAVNERRPKAKWYN